jgi:AcrR family transcriptional regulator
VRADAARNRARILAAAAEVFAAHGSSASTEEVAARAGVAIGTVFRHFPTKNDLLAAIMKDLLDSLVADIEALSDQDGETAPGTRLFVFFERLVAQAGAKKAVVDLLAAAGTDIRLPETLKVFEAAVGHLLRQGQAAGTIAPGVALPEVMALLTSTSQGAVQGGWSPALQRSVLRVIVEGLAPEGQRRSRSGEAVLFPGP